MTIQAIARNNGVAVYSQISRILEKELGENHQVGEYLPAEQDLANRFDVNRHTLRRAIEELVEKGLIERHHGKGNFVVETTLDYSINQGTRFTETLAALGKSTDTTLLQKEVVEARAGVAKQLQLEKGAPVIMLETLRQVDGKPFCIVSHFIPQARNQVILDNYIQGSLHQFIKDRLKVSLKRTKSLVTSVMPQGDDSRHLKMPRNMPILRVKSINVHHDTKQPFEYALTRFRADRVQLSVTP